MAPVGAVQTLLSPAELSYLHSSLSLSPPIRPDGRTTTQFRPLVAETDILPGTNGSARICFADGTEAIVGVKAEVEKSAVRRAGNAEVEGDNDTVNVSKDDDVSAGENSWVELSIEIPGFRDDDSLPVFLSAMLNEGLLASGELPRRLRINARFHWKLYIDILLLSPPQSYPLPLLSLTTHLALLHARVPRLKSELDEDPLFDDDWAASVPLYSPPLSSSSSSTSVNKPSTSTSSAPAPASKSSLASPANTPIPSRPPITLLVMAVGNNILFDPSREELVVAEVVLAVSVGETSSSFSSSPSILSNPSSSGPSGPSTTSSASGPGASSSSAPAASSKSDSETKRTLHLLSARTIDPPSRLTPPGVPNELNTATGGTAPVSAADAIAAREQILGAVWTPPRGGVKRGLLSRMIDLVLRRGGVADEVLDGLGGVDV
ncbi:hypothetical protein L228DRAFT_270789 [Xylona heveae TC161]|uniref:Ribosomal RNA-processing protein 42 n=1 Tax=Xylona heveae (strain CBS 132557 / TC161) TaxID=1328760 RepID=A0A165A6R7_XYLHT|nr:hypothetical protein L228DRAFT_270789 [Xylona heveae TC161]KZF20031.1 hypothetical protein L228DRAFT_270789 [Xylona heveae TC161]